MRRRGRYYYGYIVLATAWLSYFTTFGLLIYSASVANTEMVRQGGLDTASIGIATALSSFIQGALGPLAGSVNHRIGIRFSMTGGALVLLFGCLLMALYVSAEAAFILVFGAIMGVGLAFAGTITVQTAVNNWFEKNKAMAMAFVMASTGVGGIVAPLMAQAITQSLGWRANWFVIAGFCFVVGASSALLLINKPADLGLVIDGVDTGAPGVPSDAAFKKPSAKPPLKFSGVVRTRRFVVFMGGFAMRSTAFYCLTGYVLLMMYSKNLSPAQAAMILPTVSAASFAGKFLGGMNFPRGANSSRLVGFDLIAMAAALAVLALRPQYLAVRIFAPAIFGLGLGGTTVRLPIEVASTYKPENFAVVIGWLGPANSMVASAGPLLLGISAKYVGYTLPFVVLAAFCFVAGLAFLAPDKRATPAAPGISPP